MSGKKALHGMLGKTVITEDGSKVRITEIDHSYRYPNKAIINGDKFINYLELFAQVNENTRPTKEEVDEFNKIAGQNQKHRASSPYTKADN